MVSQLPSLFVSHGTPPMAGLDDPYNSALINFGRHIAQDIKGVVCISSQWITPGPIQITSHETPFIQHNFQGFQPELYEIEYRPPNSVALTHKITELLSSHQIEVAENPYYGLDFGTWMPLRMIRPEADLPVVQISISESANYIDIMQLGHILGELRNEGILLIGSGAAAFNPNKIVWHARGEDVHPSIESFSNWLKENLLTAQVENILHFLERGPGVDFAHPNIFQLAPMFFTIGSSLKGDKPQIIFDDFKYSSLSLLTFCLGNKEIEKEILS